MSIYIECVPNISEGRQMDVVDAVVEQVSATEGVWLLDRSSDADHNRSVITFAGEPAPVKEAALKLVAKAAELIDLRTHKGKHPRMGTTDVLPFVPLEDAGIEHCIKLAVDTGHIIGSELNIPVFLYGQAASRADRRNLANVRRGQFEGLSQEIGANPERKPDFGPDAIHPSAGAIAVGAREFLIAYNVNLATDNLEAAKGIAKTIRESSGGMPAVKAMGLALGERGLVQVSMNLVNYKVTHPETVFAEIERLAAERYGVEVFESELIGLIPQAAYSPGLEARIRIREFTQEQIVEVRLRKVMYQ